MILYMTACQQADQWASTVCVNGGTSAIQEISIPRTLTVAADGRWQSGNNHGNLYNWPIGGKGGGEPVRALILSDVHSNMEALTTVLDDAVDRWGDVVWCLGDLVGYGPDPGACVQMIRRYDLLGVAGNHDLTDVGKRSADDFNYAATAAIQCTASQLSDEETDFLANLSTVVTAQLFTLVHDSLRAPVDEYLLEQDSALATLNLMQTPFCLVGHSHIPFICRENEGSPIFSQFNEDEVFSWGKRV